MPSRTRISPGNLPHQLTSFVGRRTEVRAAKQRIAESRLVTLVGVGGVGKTRLAIQVADAVRRTFPDGVWLVELDEIHDGSLVPQTVAQVLGLRETRDRPPMTVLAAHLAERRLLLVLDNCEHLAGAVTPLVEALLRAGPGVRVLATSREPLTVAGEALLAMLPLPPPEPETPPGELALGDAVTLFVDRGRAVSPGFALTEGNAAAVARICRRLDGLPLAIELAAAWLVVLAPEQIDDRLGNRLALLVRGNRAANSRHQTLRACLQWSFGLCAAEEQRLWARLSVFAGYFEQDAAERVCGAAALPGLVAKSIVTREEQGTVVRFRMLESVRGYGLERLRAGGAEPEFRRRHRDWYEGLVLRAEADWVGPRQVEWLDRLDRAHPEIRAALEFSLDVPGEHGSVLRICAALHSFWLGRGLTSEGRGWLRRALAAAEGEHTVDVLKALYTATILAAVQGDITTAAALESRGLRVADQRGDPWSLAVATLAGGAPALHGGDPATAAAKQRRALEIFEAEGDAYWTLMSLSGLAMVLAIMGDAAGAAGAYESLLTLTRANGEVRMQAMALWALSVGRWNQDRPDEAADRAKESLLLRSRLRDAFGTALCLDVLAWAAARRERFPRAAVLLGAVDALGRTMGAGATTYPDLAVHHDECVKRCREALGEPGFEAAARRGGRLGLDEAVAYALSRDDAERSARSGSAVTRREWQICELVAEGLSNREIAARLTISQRTAESHVQHVLDKLGFANRTLIGAWVAQRRGAGQ